MSALPCHLPKRSQIVVEILWVAVRRKSCFPPHGYQVGHEQWVSSRNTVQDPPHGENLWLGTKLCKRSAACRSPANRKQFGCMPPGSLLSSCYCMPLSDTCLEQKPSLLSQGHEWLEYASRVGYGILIPGMLGSGGRQAFPLVAVIVNPLPLIVKPPPNVEYSQQGQGLRGSSGFL